MSKTIKTLFNIRKVINESDTPIIVEGISKSTGVSIRTVQRHVMILVDEGLVGFRIQNHKKKFNTKHSVTKEWIEAERNSCGYEYYRL